MPKVSWKRYRPRPRRRSECRIPGSDCAGRCEAHPDREYNHGRPHLALRGKTPAERLCELRIRTPEAVRESA